MKWILAYLDLCLPSSQWGLQSTHRHAGGEMLFWA